MTGIDNFISSDMKQARIDGQWYGNADAVEIGILENVSARDSILVQKYVGLGRNELNAMKERIDTALSDKDNPSIIYPFKCMESIEKEYGDVSHTVSKLPYAFAEKYQPLDKVIFLSSFSLHSRMMASMNLAEIFEMLSQYFGHEIIRLSADAFYVDVEKGDVKVVIERILFFDFCNDVKERDYLFLMKEEKKPLSESEISRFEAYSFFRLLCIDNPYDGKVTLSQYPLLTAMAIRKIHSGKYGFIFSDVSNVYSEYIGKETFVRWKEIPSKISNAIGEELSRKDGGLSVKSPSDWLKYMRILRDCLVYSKGGFQFCNLEASNNVMIIKINEYKIPVWPRKAVYGYHIGKLEQEVKNSIIAGINQEGFMENLSSSQWVVEYEAKTWFIQPEKSIKLEMGMRIDIDGTCLTILDGGIPVQAEYELIRKQDNFDLKAERNSDDVHIQNSDFREDVVQKGGAP